MSEIEDKQALIRNASSKDSIARKQRQIRQQFDANTGGVPIGNLGNLERAAGGVADQINAARQATTPLVTDAQGQPLRPVVGQFFQDAAGPSVIDASGQVAPITPDGVAMITDADGNTRRVVVDVLPDPNTRRMMVFERTPETSEGAASRFGRLLGVGAVGGAMPKQAVNLVGPARGQIQQRATQGAARALGVSEEAAGLLRQNARRGEMQQVLRAAEEAMPADAPSLRPILDELAQRAGVGSRVRQRITERAARSTERINRALDDVLGQPLGVETQRRTIVESGREGRNAAYNLAYAQPIDYASDSGRRLESILRKNVPAEAWRRANQIIAEDPDLQDVPQILARISEDGTSVTIEALPTVRQIDLLTEALRDTAEAMPAGRLGGLGRAARTRQKLASEIRNLTKELVPEYRQALDTAAQDIRARNAIEIGRRAFQRSTPRDQLAIDLEDMTAAERQWALAGARAQLDETLANVRSTLANPESGEQAIKEARTLARDLSSRAAQDKMALLIPNERDRQRLFNELERARESFVLEAAIARNSATTPRQAVRQGIQEAAQEQATVPELLGQAEIRPAIRQHVRRRLPFAGLAGPGTRAREARIAGEMGDVLTRQGPRGGAVAFNTLTNPPASTVAGTRGQNALQDAAAAQLLTPFIAQESRPIAMPRPLTQDATFQFPR